MGSTYNDIEKALLESKTQMFIAMGLTTSEARQEAEESLEMAIDQSRKEGTYYLPTNFGDVILGNAISDDLGVMEIAAIIIKNLPKKRAEGVRDEDVKLWWNLQDVERHMMQIDDNAMKLVFFKREFERSTSSSSEKAMKEVTAKLRKTFPIYGDPADTSHTTGEDRPLPYELKDRINCYVEMRARRDSDKYKKEIETSSSFNALVRKEIRDGNL